MIKIFIKTIIIFSLSTLSCSIPPANTHLKDTLDKEPKRTTIACSFFDLKKGAHHWSFGKLSGGTDLFIKKENRDLADSAFVEGLRSHFNVMSSDSLKGILYPFINKETGETDLKESLKHLSSIDVLFLLFPHTISEDSIGLTAIRTISVEKRYKRKDIEMFVNFNRCKPYNRDCLYTEVREAGIKMGKLLYSQTNLAAHENQN